MSKKTEKKLSIWKEHLIDTSKRNKMIYFSQGNSFAAFRNISADELFEKIFSGSKDIIIEGSSEFISIPKNSDTENYMLKIYTRYNEILNEKGLKTLYIIFGLLSWNENKSDEKIDTPIILIPIDIKKNIIKNSYSVTALKNDFFINPALIYKMKTEYGENINNYDLDYSSPLSLIESIKKTFKTLNSAWEIKKSLYMGLTSYAKYSLYNDITENIKIYAGHPVISILTGDYTKNKNIPLIPAEKIDTAIKYEDNFQVLDADSSQQEAIYASVSGANFILQGPPGTGKSQTITNIISENLSRGKKILFVSEKKSAIEVVRKNLEKTDLDKYVLDLHNRNITRKEFISDLEKSLTPTELQNSLLINPAKITKLEKTRKELNRYINSLHKKNGFMKISAYDAQAELINLKNYKHIEFEIKNISKFTKSKYNAVIKILKQLTSMKSLWDNINTNPCKGFKEKEFNFETIKKIETLAENLNLYLLEAKKLFSELKPFTNVEIPDKINLMEIYSALIRTYKFDFLKTDAEKLFSKYEKSYNSKFSFGFKDHTLKKFYRYPERSVSKETIYKEIFNLKYLKENLKTEPFSSDDKIDELYMINKISDIISKISETANALTNYFDFIEIFGTQIKNADISKIILWSEKIQGNDKLFSDYIKFNFLCESLLSLEFTDIIEKFSDNGIKSYDIINTFKKRFYILWLDYIYAKEPLLKNFKGSFYKKLSEEFSSLDKEFIEKNRYRIIKILENNHPEKKDIVNENKELSELKKEIMKQSNLKTVRNILGDYPEIIKDLKPCFMMSPLSVSDFLDINKYIFDIVIFDEASQVSPEDSLASIVRAKSAVVVGDNKQLPPTNFFSNISDLDYSSEDESLLESILNEFISAGFPQKKLKWHYRSKDESLISFSNKYFYDNMLNTFPSAKSEKMQGVNFVYVPEGVYDRGGKKNNIQEAKKIAEMVFDHFRNSPEKSLGIVTFNEAQQITIINEINKLRKNNGKFEKFFDEKIPEYFFVKNLETIQGDERDTIIFSLGYAKDKDGNFSMNFGPLNKPGGERRLNVAVTRARFSMLVVSSVKYYEIDTSKSESLGLKALKDYLFFAENKNISADVKTEKNVSDPFCDTLKKEFDSTGTEYNENFGTAEYKIDFVIKKSGNFSTAIETDGKNYIKSFTARDRDRIRPEMLKQMGWEFRKIWSRDFTENFDNEFGKLTGNKTSDNNNYDNSVTVNKKKKGFIYYKEYTPEKFYASDDIKNIYKELHKIIKTEAPVHKKIIALKLSVILKNKNPGKKTYEIINGFLNSENTLYTEKNDFVFLNGKPVKPRIFQDLSKKRELSYISDEELSESVINISKYGHLKDNEDIIHETYLTLNIKDSYRKSKKRISDQLKILINKKKI